MTQSPSPASHHDDGDDNGDDDDDDDDNYDDRHPSIIVVGVKDLIESWVSLFLIQEINQPGVKHMLICSRNQKVLMVKFI